MGCGYGVQCIRDVRSGHHRELHHTAYQALYCGNSLPLGSPSLLGYLDQHLGYLGCLISQRFNTAPPGSPQKKPVSPPGHRIPKLAQCTVSVHPELVVVFHRESLLQLSEERVVSTFLTRHNNRNNVTSPLTNLGKTHRSALHCSRSITSNFHNFRVEDITPYKPGLGFTGYSGVLQPYQKVHDILGEGTCIFPLPGAPVQAPKTHPSGKTANQARPV